MLLISEYRDIKNYVRDILLLKDEYKSHLYYFDEFYEKNIIKEDEPDSAPEFLLVNRNKSYLEKSMVKFLEKNGVKRNSNKNYQIKKKKGFNFGWPLKRNNFWISSYFGPRKNGNRKIGFHKGLDMAAIKGTLVMSAADGVVDSAMNSNGYGRNILIRHNSKYKTRYAHLQSISVKVGERVRKGQVIGRVGDSGIVRGKRDPSHLHFEICEFNKQVNPMRYLT